MELIIGLGLGLAAGALAMATYVHRQDRKARH